jgi:tripartite-type tricarboxylate transporter receptor subunit TctC
MRRAALVLCAAVCLYGTAQSVIAQSFPVRPIRLVVPFAAGGPNDFVARIIGPRLGEALKTSVVVDDRPGAGGNIGTSLAAKGSRDGHTLVLVGIHFVANPHLYSEVGYDPMRDFAPVTLAAVSPVIIVAHPSLPAQNVRELVELAKRTTVNYASPGTGTAGHLCAEVFSTTTGIKLQHIPYKGAAPATNDLLGGQVKLGFPSLPPTTPHVLSGRLKGIAVTTLKRSSALPQVPTVDESGYPGFSVDNIYGILTTAGTPQATIDRLNVELVRILKLPEVHERLASQGYDPIANKPEEFARHLQTEITRWGKVIGEAGLKVQ